MWMCITEQLPKPFVRVWVLTDTERQTTGYVNSNEEWVINCQSIHASGAKVLRWRY